MNTTKQFLSAFLVVLVILPASIVLSQEFPKSHELPSSHNAPGKLEGTYEGPWVTTRSKKLNGILKCQVKQLAPDRWQGRFWGEWQQVPIDYTVEFVSVEQQKQRDKIVRVDQQNVQNNENASTTDDPSHRPRDNQSAQRTTEQFNDFVRNAANPVIGTAIIDGASYTWAGNLTASEFDIQFTGNRYDGNLKLKREPSKR